MKSKRDIVTSLSEAMLNRPSDTVIAAAIAESIQGYAGVKMAIGELSEDEQETAHALYQSRYSQSEWNLGIPYPENNSR